MHIYDEKHPKNINENSAELHLAYPGNDVPGCRMDEIEDLAIAETDPGLWFENNFG